MKLSAWLAGALLLVSHVLQAEDLKGTVSSVDAKKNSIVVTVDGKAKTFDVAKDATIVSQGDGSKKKAAPITPVADGLAGVKAGESVEFRTEEQDGKTVVTSLKIESKPGKPAAAAPATPAARKPAPNANPAQKLRKKSKRALNGATAGRKPSLRKAIAARKRALRGK